MRQIFMGVLLAAFASFGTLGWAGNSNSSQNNSDVHARLNSATQIIQSMTTQAPDKGIPQAVLNNAKCVAVIPGMIKGAFIVGGRHGSGFATCKTSDGWSAPAPFSLTGVSWGAQIGGQSTDLVMMVMNQQGMDGMLSGHFKVGAGVSAAAGPVGRQASASGAWKAGVLTYSRSKGAFVGASLKGAEIQQDDSATKNLYGHNVSFHDILKGQAQTPEMAQQFVQAVSTAVTHATQTASAK